MLTPQDMAIAEARASGATLVEIGEQNGIAKSTVHLRLEKPELKEHLENIQLTTIQQNAQTAADNLTYLIQGYRNNKCRSHQTRIEKSHGARLTERMCEGIGILPSHSPSSVVIQIMAQGNTYISPQITQILQQIEGKADGTVIDIPVLDLDMEGSKK